MVTTSTNGTAHSAGYCSTVAVNPACVKKCPASSAPSETNPPVTIPAMAPDTVNPRHQIAKSTTGANDEAVKVKTMATAPARANPRSEERRVGKECRAGSAQERRVQQEGDAKSK